MNTRYVNKVDANRCEVSNEPPNDMKEDTVHVVSMDGSHHVFCTTASSTYRGIGYYIESGYLDVNAHGYRDEQPMCTFAPNGWMSVEGTRYSEHKTVSIGHASS